MLAEPCICCGAQEQPEGSADTEHPFPKCMLGQDLPVDPVAEYQGEFRYWLARKSSDLPSHPIALGQHVSSPTRIALSPESISYSGKRLSRKPNPLVNSFNILMYYVNNYRVNWRPSVWRGLT